MRPYRKNGTLRIFKAGRYDVVIGPRWYWLGAERCGGRWLIGFGFGRAII